MTKPIFRPAIRVSYAHGGDTLPGKAVTLFQRHDTPTLPILNAVNALWREIQVNHPGVPNVNIVLQASEYAHGHFAPNAWEGSAQHELMLSTISLGLTTNADSLNAPVIKTVSTLLHEAAHAFAFSRGIQDTSRGHRYHNGRFADIARAFGCEVSDSPDPRIGFYTDGITPQARIRYAAQIDTLMSAVTAYRRDFSGLSAGAGMGLFGTLTGPRARKPRKTYGSATLTVMCECEGKFHRVDRSLFDSATIHCNDCNTDMIER
jgi:hypothetical protein